MDIKDLTSTMIAKGRESSTASLELHLKLVNENLALLALELKELEPHIMLEKSLTPAEPDTIISSKFYFDVREEDITIFQTGDDLCKWTLELDILRDYPEETRLEPHILTINLPTDREGYLILTADKSINKLEQVSPVYLPQRVDLYHPEGSIQSLIKWAEEVTKE